MNKYIQIIMFTFLSNFFFGQSKIEFKKLQSYVPNNTVIAHRGTMFWAPEATESAFRWARNIGVDYLEGDMRKTKDGIIVIFHDDNLKRTTNIAQVFPDKKNLKINDFTYEELLKLDVGSWFNKALPDNARKSFANEPILTLEDMIMISRGYKLKIDSKKKRIYRRTEDKEGEIRYNFEYEKDLKDNGNRPGLYLEFKEFNEEQEVYNVLNKYNIASIDEKNNTFSKNFRKNRKINIGNTQGRVVFQTFMPKVIKKANKIFKNQIPMCYLIGGDKLALSDEDFRKMIIESIKDGYQFLGPSIFYKKEEKANYKAKKAIASEYNLKFHPFTFDTVEQMDIVYPLYEGAFTNRGDMTINFYVSKGLRSKTNFLDAKQTLDDLGY